MNEWLRWENTNVLPKSALNFINTKGVLKYNGSITFVFYKGDVETTENWFMVTDDGGFYKVGANYVMWTPTVIKCAWSSKSLFDMINAYLDGRPVPNDPDYQT